MKKILLILCSSLELLAYDYRAEVRALDQPASPVLFEIKLNRSTDGEITKINASFVEKNKPVLIESAVVNNLNADVLEYSVKSEQTGESGLVKITGDKIKIDYKSSDKSESKEIPKPKTLVAPANFEIWFEKNFTTLKEKKSLSVPFLIWDRMETIGFKVSYLGEESVDGQKMQAFKMNIDNIFLSTFISPIRIWYSQDMTRIQRYRGRVAVKQKSGDDYVNLDADVKYFYN